MSVDHHNGSGLVINFHTIIPTYNRAPSLRRLLASLRTLEYPPDVSLEIIVVNNRCTDETADLLKVEQAQKTQFTLRVLEETRKGKAAALNRGLSESNAQILAILDDDVVVDPAWLAEHVTTHREAAFDVVQGRVLPGREVTGGGPADPSKLHEYNILVIDHGQEPHEIRGFAGTNVSFKRAVLERCGVFDARLGPGAAGFSEDTEYSRRVRAAGFKIGYAPSATAYHELNPSRYGRGYNRAVEYRKGVSRAIYRRDSIARKVVPSLILNCIRYVVYRVSGNRRKAYKTEGRIMKDWGYLIGRLHRAGFNISSRIGCLLSLSSATSALFLD